MQNPCEQQYTCSPIAYNLPECSFSCPSRPPLFTAPGYFSSLPNNLPPALLSQKPTVTMAKPYNNQKKSAPMHGISNATTGYFIEKQCFL